LARDIDASVGNHFPKFLFVELAHPGLGNMMEKDEFVRNPPRGPDLVLQKAVQLFSGHRFTGFKDHTAQAYFLGKYFTPRNSNVLSSSG
jgi:hypothetical protein